MALVSMTGFGEAAVTLSASELRVEVKSVNNRFLDCGVKLPGLFSARESDIQSLARKYCRRGRVDLSVSRSTQRGAELNFSLNTEQLKNYFEVVEKACQQTTVAFDAVKGEALMQALSRREILEMAQVEKPDEQEQQALLAVVETALQKLAQMRLVEGAQLEAAMQANLGKLKQLTAGIEKLADTVSASIRTRLEERLAKLAPMVQVDPQRLAQEVVMIADKGDISEELVRLVSHFAQFETAIAQGEGGRKLEFILQECNREVNTIGSKSQDKEVTALVVEAKTELEKIREQVQNVE